MDKICPECAATFTPHNGRQVFCCTKHKQRFWKVMEVRGRMLMPFALTDRGLTHSRKPEAVTLSKWSRTQKDGLARRWAQDDRLCGRNASLVAAAKMADLWSYVDAV